MTYIAFLRAINVAGHASLKMTDARDAFAAAGCRNVRTYIQSGNVLFEVPRRANVVGDPSCGEETTGRCVRG